jgi:hypothetical protein
VKVPWLNTRDLIIWLVVADVFIWLLALDFVHGQPGRVDRMADATSLMMLSA